MENSIRSFKDLLVWQKGMRIAVESYRLSGRFPKEEVFGLTSQIRRSSCSIALNIAEGHGRSTTKSYVNFLHNARASAQEGETAMLLAIELGFIRKEDSFSLASLIEEERKMLNVLIKTLKVKTEQQPSTPQSLTPDS